MNVRIEMLRDRERIRKLLRRHGWRLDRADGEASYLARHPAVTDRASARDRLDAAGLLTSSALRIEFVPRASGPAINTPSL
jgi:hypothetical protein